MKKKLVSGIMAAVMLCCLMPATAFALPESNIIDAQTALSYTVEASEGYYEVEIPQTLNLNESEYIYFAANSLNITENQLLTIRLNTSRTFTNGELLLENMYAETISAELQRIDINTGMAININSGNPVVSTFAASGTPGDYLRAVPVYSSSSRPGEYTGYIYFTIAVENRQG